MTIGWYVHHHGAGHLHRFLAVREHLGADVVGLGSLPRPAAVPPGAWIALPGDVPTGEADDPTAGGALHWAPRRVPGLRARTAAIAAWAAAADPAVLVVDVSVEVALLGRLLSVPTVLVAQRGRRTDRPHATAYAGASAVLAPWTAATHVPGDGPPEDRLVLCGAVSRFDGDGRWGGLASGVAAGRASGVAAGRASAVDAGPASEVAAGPASGVGGAPAPSGVRPVAHTFVARHPRRVLLLVGAGGHALRPDDVTVAAAATSGVAWDVAGALRVPERPGIVDHGPDADVPALLDAADVVVGTAGGNVAAEVAAARRPLIVLPQDRPFAEQERQAELLAAAGLATALTAWPPPADWPALLRDAAARPVDRWTAHHDGQGARRMAAAIRAVAAGGDPRAAADAVEPAPAHARPAAARAGASRGPSRPAVAR